MCTKLGRGKSLKTAVQNVAELTPILLPDIGQVKNRRLRAKLRHSDSTENVVGRLIL
jgi:hypothetical protein